MNESAKIAIGLVINQIEGKYQSRIYRGLADFAEDEGIDLYCFVGRSLASPYGNEDQYNTIYSLAKSKRLSGLVVTAGSIGSFLPVSDVADFLVGFAPLPIVTIGMSIPGIPSIRTNNRDGIRTIVKHLVEAHRARRIAFVGGPETSQDANERLGGYREALAENGLDAREDIVFHSDFSFQGSQQVVDALSLDDGLPFDAVVCANDEMAIGFMTAMERRGFRAPFDYLITGFDDVPEVEKCDPALTSVAQPIYEEAILAGKALVSLIRGNEIPDLTVIEAKPIPRGSCGCDDQAPVISRYQAQAKRNAPAESDRQREALLASLSEGLTLGAAQIHRAQEACGALFDTLSLDLRAFRERPLFITTLRDWLDITRDWDDASGIWRTILSRLQDSVLGRTEELRAHLYLEDLFKNAFSALARFTGREAGREVMSLRGYLEKFKDLSRTLEDAASVGDIVKAAYACAGGFAIDGISVCLHADGPKPIGPLARGENPYGPMRWVAPPAEEAGFSAEEIAPAAAFPRQAKALRRELVIMPLQGRGVSFGYIAFVGTKTPPVIFDIFRDYVSRAFESVERLERARLAERALAEATERVRENGERFRVISETLPMLVIETNPSLAVQYANRTAQKSLALDGTPETLAGFIHRDDARKVADIVSALEPDKLIEFPGIRLVEPESRRLIPILRISGIFSGKGTQLTGILWNAFDLRPSVPGLLLPDGRFFESRHLSDRETEIARLILQGFRTSDIAERLFIAESTVKGHIGHIYDKFGVSGRPGLINLAQEEQSDKYGFNAYVFSVLNGMIDQAKTT
jgi:DNA-binding LacI/PurR family transcriptional regulator/DNA-binding CsgD family transcriptional regulator